MLSEQNKKEIREFLLPLMSWIEENETGILLCETVNDVSEKFENQFSSLEIESYLIEICTIEGKDSCEPYISKINIEISKEDCPMPAIVVYNDYLKERFKMDGVYLLLENDNYSTLGEYCKDYDIDLTKVELAPYPFRNFLYSEQFKDICRVEYFDSKDDDIGMTNFIVEYEDNLYILGHSKEFYINRTIDSYDLQKEENIQILKTVKQARENETQGTVWVDLRDIAEYTNKLKQ